MPLNSDQLAELRELITPAGQLAYDALPENLQLNLDVRLRMVGGDLNLLAAAMLRVLCQQATLTAAGATSGNVKRFKVDGEYEEEYFAPTSVESATASNWCALAAALETASAGSGVPGPRLTPLGRESPGLTAGAEAEVYRDW